MKILAAVSLSLLGLAGCASNQGSPSLPFFPQVAPTPPGFEEVWLTAAFEGRLVVENGCVKVRSPSERQNTTVLWYQGIELGRDKNGLFIRNSYTAELTRFDVLAKFGGGSASVEHVGQDYPEVARRCGPPYAVGYPAGAP